MIAWQMLKCHNLQPLQRNIAYVFMAKNILWKTVSPYKERLDTLDSKGEMKHDQQSFTVIKK